MPSLGRAACACYVTPCAAHGARHGARVGVAAMGALFLALAASDDHADDSAVSLAALIGVPITLGAAVAGMLAEPGTRWQPVAMPVRVGPAQETRGDEEAPMHAVRRHPAGAPGLRAARSPFDPRP
jgi:hypothetical protein